MPEWKMQRVLIQLGGLKIVICHVRRLRFSSLINQTNHLLSIFYWFVREFCKELVAWQLCH